MQDDAPGASPVERTVRHLRIAATLLVPLLIIFAGLGVSMLTQWLDQFLAGKAMMVLFLAAIVGWMAWTVWNWPDWRRDEDA